jgi:hypothetical protein
MSRQVKVRRVKKMERPGNVLLRSSKRRRRGRSRYQAFSLCVSVVV